MSVKIASLHISNAQNKKKIRKFDIYNRRFKIDFDRILIKFDFSQKIDISNDIFY